MGRGRNAIARLVCGSALRFNRAYPESLPTLPARRAIYTGVRTYPFHNGDFRLKGDFVPAPGWGPIPEEQETLAEILRASGWRTGLISDLYHQFKPSKNFWRGFDQWTFVRGQEADPARSGPHPSAADVDYWCPKELGIREPERTDLVTRCLANMYDRESEEDWTTVQVFRQAAEWLEQNADADRMFLTVESFDPHEPWFVPESYRSLQGARPSQEQVFSPYSDIATLPAHLLERTHANYSSLVTMVDDWFGYLVDAIDGLGLADRTMIIHTSDHGHTLGEGGFMGKRGYPSGPETVDVPLAVRLPDEAKAGEQTDILVQHHDIAPFVLDMVGVGVPEAVDGRSFRDAAFGDGEPIREHVTIGWGSSVTVIRDDWWLNCKVDGSGVLLHQLGKGERPTNRNLVESSAVAEELFALACADAHNDFPDYLVELARGTDDAPGCSAVAARPL